jgi:predicted aldo/keto reductase-like oxidoreductase
VGAIELLDRCAPGLPRIPCKSAQRKQAAATAELDRSLQRLRTDPFDLYQLHRVTRPEEVETIFGDDGAIKAFEKAKQDGKHNRTEQRCSGLLARLTAT